MPEALSLAKEQDLDLVEVADKADPPVCRIMDYGNYEYQAAKRARESRRKSSTTVLKEMKYRPKIGVGDFDTKTRKVERFLSEGHKVKVTIMFRGREVYHPELGAKILDHVAEVVSHLGRVEVYPKGVEGRNMTMVLAPDKKAQAQHAAEHKAGGRKGASGQVTPEQGGADGSSPARAAEAPAEQAPNGVPGGDGALSGNGSDHGAEDHADATSEAATGTLTES